jgi:hypothetical protein
MRDDTPQWLRWTYLGLLLALAFSLGGSIGFGQGKQWFADQLQYERASDETKNVFTQCLLDGWAAMEEEQANEPAT